MIELEKLKVSKVLSRLPLIFERNIGQHHEEVQFVLNKNECTTFFTDTELVLAFRSNEKIGELENIDSSSIVNSALNNLSEYKVNVLRINFEDSNKIPQIIGKNEFNCKINYFKGDNKSTWKNCIPIYEKLLYKEIYPGIDLLYYGKQTDMNLEFIVQPNKNIECIKLNFECADNIKIDEDGNLIIRFDDKSLKILKLEAVQEENENKIECNFEIEDNFKVKFNILNYDLGEVLKIRMQFLFKAFKLTKVTDRGNSIAVDNNNCIYITGVTNIQRFPEKRLYNTIYSGNDYSAYIVKINTKKSGQAILEYGAYLGGNGVDEGVSVAVDYSGGVYVAGTTNSISGFPTTEKSYLSSYPGGETTWFLVKIDTREIGITSLVYGTYLGGNGSDYIYSIALDKNKNVYIVGDTTSNEGFPITEGAYKTFKNENNKCGFLLKLDTRMKRKESLVYGTYFGGTISDSFYSVAIDCNNYVYITGVTKSNDFPTTDSGYEKNNYNDLNNTFLVKFDVNKGGEEGILYSSYLSGNGNDIGYSVAVDYNECAYITGVTTSSEEFPITEKSFQTEILNSRENGFLVKLDTKMHGRKSLIYGTYLSGNGIDVCSDIKIDSNNYIYIIGFTSSKNLLVDNCNYKDVLLNEEFYSFLLKMDISKEGKLALLNSACFGDNGYDFALAMDVDADLNAYVIGYSNSTIRNGINSNKSMNDSDNIFLNKISTRIYNLVAEKDNYRAFVEVGEKTEYTINIINNGPDVAKNVVVIDDLQKGLIIKGIRVSSGSIHQVGSELIWKIDKIRPNEKLSANITVKVSIKDEAVSSNLVIDTFDNSYGYRSGTYESKMYRYLV